MNAMNAMKDSTDNLLSSHNTTKQRGSNSKNTSKNRGKKKYPKKRANLNRAKNKTAATAQTGQKATVKAQNSQTTVPSQASKNTNKKTTKQTENKQNKSDRQRNKRSGSTRRQDNNFRKATNIKKLEANKLRVVPLGGCEEVGRNMTVFEYGNDIIVVDMGLQWPEEDMPGIDYIIPNIEYLKGKEKNIRGVIITHGHYDHIGAIPHLIPKMGHPTIYGTPLTLGIIAKRQEDFKGQKALKLKSITTSNKLVLGKFKLS